MVHIGAIEQQHERAYQKHIRTSLFNKKEVIATGACKLRRVIRKPRLGFEVPAAAIEGSYIDRKCPFTSPLTIRGAIIKGIVISTKMKRTIVVRRNYLHYVKKYNRFEKRHSNISAHCSPCFEVKDGDIATIGECRPLAKTVRFNVIKVEPRQIFGSARKQFALF